MRTLTLPVALLLFQSLLSHPLGPHVVKGEAALRHASPDKTVITLSDDAFIHWDDFSIDSSETVAFEQPTPTSIAVNRVVTSTPSTILGRLEANGKIVLLNQNGILVGRCASIDTEAFLASTLDTLDDAFKAARSLKADGHPLRIEGTLIARSGSLILQGSGDILCEGVLRAQEISLSSRDGAISISGHLDASNKSGIGGKVSIIGEENRILPSSFIDVSGEAGGGTIWVGSGFKGLNPLGENSKRSFISSEAALRADADLRGNGGTIVIWGTDVVQSEGMLSAQGGREGGDGGMIEISSKGFLAPRGNVSTFAPKGRIGELLLDPCSVILSTAADSGIMASPPPSYSFSGSAANINIATLITFLTASNVTIDASASGTAGIGSITLAADTDVPAGTSVIWDSSTMAPNLPTRLTLTADGFIDIRNGIFSMHPTAAQNDTVIEITAPVVTIGDPSTALGNVAVVQAQTGSIELHASSSLTVYGNNASAGGLIAGTLAPADVGSISIDAGSVFLQSGSNLTTFAANGDVSIDSVGNLQFISGTAPAGVQTLQAGSLIQISGGGNLSLQGGSGINSSCAIVSVLGGTIDVSLAGDYYLTGGSAAIDGNSGISVNGGTGSITVTGRDYFLTGGVTGANTNIAVIGIVNTASGTVDVTATGANGIVCVSQGGNGAGFLTQGLMGVNDIHIQTTNLTLYGSLDPASSNASGQVSSNAGSISINATGDISLIGGLGLGQNGAFIQANSATALQVAARNLQLAGGSGMLSLAAIFNFGGPVALDLSGDYLLTGGSGDLSIAAIVSAMMGGAGDLHATGRNAVVTAGSGMLASAGFFTGDILMGVGGNGSITLNLTGSSGLSLIAGAGPSIAAIQTIGPLSTNQISVYIPHPSANLTLSAHGFGPLASAIINTIGGGPIDISVGHDISLSDSGGNLSSIRVGAGGSGDLIASAGHSLSINSTIENLGSGNLFLIVDAAFPSSPLFGSGSLSLGPNALVNTTGGLLKIYTSQQSLNSISGLLNGVSFIPGPLFINSGAEVWCTYYPAGAGGTPFIIFYKECLQELASQAALIADESLEDLHPMNENPGWRERFFIRSENKEESYETEHFLRRRHLKTVNHPKTYTTL